MAGELSASSHTLSGSKLEFYQQNDDTIRVRVYDTPTSAQYEVIITAAHWTSLVAALSSAGDSYSTAEELAPAGASHTVVIA